MYKLTLLSVLLLALAVSQSLAIRGGKRSRQRQPPRQGPPSRQDQPPGQGSSQDQNSQARDDLPSLGELFGRARKSRGKRCVQACEVQYNGTVIRNATCDDDEFCSDESALTLTRGQDTVTFKFCNRSLEITPRMACRVQNESGTVLYNKSCLVGECNSDPFIFDNSDDDEEANDEGDEEANDDDGEEGNGDDDEEGKEGDGDNSPIRNILDKIRKRWNRRGHCDKRFPEGNLTLTFCNAIPTAVDYAPLLLRHACRIMDDEGVVRKDKTCRTRRRPFRGEPCPVDNPVTLPFQGVQLEVNFCDPDVDITELFGGRDDDDDDDGMDVDDGEDDDDDLEDDECSLDGRFGRKHGGRFGGFGGFGGAGGFFGGGSKIRGNNGRDRSEQEPSGEQQEGQQGGPPEGRGNRGQRGRGSG